MLAMELAVLAVLVLLGIAAKKLGIYKVSSPSKNAVALVYFGSAMLVALFVGDLVGTYLLPSLLAESELAWPLLSVSSNLNLIVVFFSVLFIGIGLLLVLRSMGRYETTLDHSESRYRTIVEDQSDLIVRWDMEGIRTWVNDAYCAYFQQPSEELVGTSFFPLLTDEVMKEYLAKFRTLTPDAPSLTGENTLVMLDGSQRWQEWTHHVIFDRDGKRVECQSVGRDITVRKMSEFALKESETRYRDLVENTSDWVWQTDLKGKHTYTNSQLEVILGYSMEEISTLSLKEMFHPDELDDIYARLSNAAAKKEGWQHWQLKMRHKNGSYRYLDSNAIPRLDSSGAMIGFSGIDRDVTFNTLLTEASTALLSVNLRSLQIDEVMHKFAEYFHVDRFELWWRDKSRESSTLAYSWSRADLGETASELSLSKMPLIAAKLRDSKIIHVADTSELSPEFVSEALSAGLTVSRAFAIFPLSINEEQERLGTGRVAVYESARYWTEEEINELQLAFSLIATAEARRRTKIELEDRERFHALVAEVSTDLLKVTVDDAALTKALHRFAAHFGVDSLSCWWFDRVNQLARRSCTWFLEGSNTGPSVFELGSFPQYEGPVLAGEVVRVSDTREFHSSSSAEKALYESMGITASLSVPLELGFEQNFVGCGVALTFNGTREWPDQEVEDLQLAFNVIAIAEARMQSESELHGREKFQTLLAEISTILLEAQLDEIGEKIDSSLNQIAQHYVLDRASLWYFEDNRRVVKCVHQSTLQDDAMPTPIELDKIPWIGERILNGRDVHLDSVEDVPLEYEADRAFFAKHGVKSELGLPSMVDDQQVGVGVFVTQKQVRSWSEKTKNELRLLVEVLMNAFSRAKASQTNQQRERDLARSEALANVGSYSFFPSGDLKDWPPFGKAYFSEEMQILFDCKSEVASFEVFISRVHKDDRERVQDSIRELLARGSVLHHEYRLVGRDGKITHVEDRSEVDKSKNAPEIIKIFGSLKDVSERVERENKLKDALAQIEKLRENLEEENLDLRDEIRSAHGFDKIIGNSIPLQRCLDLVKKVAPTNATVMLLGETGSGKELIAHAVHDQSARKTMRMVSVNCAVLPESLIESELFGHEKGAFTGAEKVRKGRFELADGGTLFLDEIGELPLSLQSKLLRVIQEGEFERLGGSRTLKIDVRIIAATNRQLKNSVDEGSFRADLYYRISNFPIEVPSLSERKGDIPLLAEHFVRKFAPELGKDIKAISNGMLRYLTQKPWPGNVRELEGFIQHALITNEGDVLTLSAQNDNPTQLLSEHGELLDAEKITLSSVEHKHIVNVLNQTDWMISGKKGAAKILGVPPSTLRSRMKKLGIENPERSATI